MQTTETLRPTRAAPPVPTGAIALTGALSLAAAAASAAYSNFRGPGGKLSDYLIILGIGAAVALLTFAVAVPRALRSADGNSPAAAGLVASILAVLTVAVFFTGAAFILGAAGVLLALAGRRRALAGARGAGIAVAALALAVLSSVGQVAAVVTDSPAPDGNPPALPPAQEASITASDAWRTAGFEGLVAGWIAISFETVEGSADHGLQIVRLKEGATFDSALEAVQSDDIADFLAVAEPIGGFVGVRGAQTLRLTLRLDAGSYAMFDFGGGPEGPNFLNGMATGFEVAAAEAPVGSAPAAEGEIVLTEYAVGMPGSFTGRGTYLVRNEGAALHELNIGALPAGADAAAEIEKHAETGRGALEERPGVAIMAPGAQVYVDLDLDPGPYVFACFLTAGPDDPVHASEGMWSETTVA